MKVFTFFETTMANHIMPTVTIPTKINSKKNTGINNIWPNQNIPRDDMMSGNLTIAISDHLLSFIILPKNNHLRNKVNKEF